MENFTDTLAAFDAILQKYNPLGYASLQPPATADQIERFCARFNVANQQFVELYKWKNGFTWNGMGDTDFFEIGGAGIIQSLESLEADMTSSSREYWKTPDHQFIPLFRTMDPDYLLFDRKSSTGMLSVYSEPEFITPKTYADSLQSLILTYIEAYKQEVFQVDEDGWMDVDFPALREIATPLNPHSAYWLTTDVD
jgi:hypothetical protein